MNYLVKAALTGAALASGSLAGMDMASGMPEYDGQQNTSSRNTPPNIILIMTDQHNADYLHCMGRDYLRTPGLDKLASHAFIFRSAYTASPVCGPSRAAIFTGQYPLENGVYTNWKPVNGGSVLLTDLLASAGYYNAMIGKLHLTPVDSSHGFVYRKICDSPYDVYDKREVIFNDYLTWAAACTGLSRHELVERAGKCERQAIDNPDFWLGKSWADDKCQITTWTGNEAVSFIGSYSNPKPFFLHVSFFGPHHPYTTSEPWISMYDPDKVELPPTLRQAEPGVQTGFRANWPDSLWREIIARYSGSITAIDYQIGRIIKALKDKGIWDNTLIVFTSDHGDHMGDFSMLGKGTMLQSSVRVPFMIKPPGKSVQAKEMPQVINLIDLYATFLDYAGVTENVPAESVSLRPLLENRGPWRNQTFSSLCSPDGLNGQVMFIRDRYKCVGFLKDGKMSVELYDLSRDSPDSENLAAIPGYTSVADEMGLTAIRWIENMLKSGARVSLSTQTGSR